MKTRQARKEQARKARKAFFPILGELHPSGLNRHSRRRYVAEKKGKALVGMHARKCRIGEARGRAYDRALRAGEIRPKLHKMQRYV